jgi:hypothetical protein
MTKRRQKFHGTKLPQPNFRIIINELARHWRAFSLCAEHDRQLGGVSPLPSLMVAKG